MTAASPQSTPSEARHPKQLPNLSVEPQTQPEPATQDSLDRRTKLVLAAAILLLGTPFLMFDFDVGGIRQAAQPELQPEEIARLTAEFATFKGQLPGIDLSTTAAQSEAIRSMHRPEREARQLITDVLAGKRSLVKISVWDNVREDGDTVQVSSGGMTTQFVLTKVPMTIVMPFDPGASVTITGLRDGGGGITAAVELTTGPLPLPPLSVGEMRVLPLF